MSRAEALAERLGERELDAMLVTGLVNVRYLTGFTGTNGLVLVTPEARHFVTDFRYRAQAAEQVAGFDVTIAAEQLLTAVGGLLAKGGARLGFEDDKLSVREHARLAGELGGEVALIAAGGIVEELRAVKDADETARIRAAAKLADAAFEQVVAEGIAGRTERAVALALEDAMRAAGAQQPSFPTIVAAGPHGALPHAVPRDVEIPRDALVVIDWGAQLDGYCSDCTRTLATGSVAEEARQVYELVLRAQQAGLDAVAPGREGVEVDAVARRVIEEGGQGERFGHGLGHGVGLEIHEAPRLARTATGTLDEGNVVTVEPGVYVPGEFGVRIEDLVLVGPGEPEILSGFAKELTAV